MNRPTIEWLVNTLGAECSVVKQNQPIQNISIDTRSIESGDFFWVIKANRDGHEFVHEAFSKGASFAVVSKEWGQTSEATQYHDRLIQVDNTFEALTHAAKAWRRELKIPIIAITGSNGKTSTKDILLHLLREKYRAAGTTGNRNNELGLPLTLLSIGKDDEIAVLEMGAAKQGDIDYLCRIAEPTHGLITSISRAHLSGFKTIEGVAETKGELYDYLKASGFGFVPIEDSYCLEQAEVLSHKCGYGFVAPPVDWTGSFLQATDYRIDKNGCGTFKLLNSVATLPYPGKPIAQAALAAVTIADHFDIPIEKSIHRLSSVILTSGRVSLLRIGKLTILDDSYNANPMSMKAALDTLAAMPGRNKAVILGDMNELGEYSIQAHEELGQQVAALNPTLAIFVGPLSEDSYSVVRSEGIRSLHFSSFEELEPELPAHLKNINILLIKASRTIGLDRIPAQLTQSIL